MLPVEERLKSALTAPSEVLWSVIKDPHPEVLSNAVMNRNLTEEMAIFIAKGRTVSPETLGFLAGDARFKTSYKLKLAICRNRKTPQRVTLSLLKFIRIFDLADIAKDRHININVRRKVESMIAEKIPAMPSGNKAALAKRANTNILQSLMGSGEDKVIDICLDSPAMTEAQLYGLLSRPDINRAAVRRIADHPKWSLSYYVRFALIRNFYTPMEFVRRFISAMKTGDLRDLYSDPKIPSSTRPFIFRELTERGETFETPKEEVYDLSGDEDSCLTDSGDDGQKVDGGVDPRT